MKMIKDDFNKAMDFRHACKIFDKSKKVSDEDMRFILEMGRKSPSSVGLEAWKFLVINGDELKEKIKPICWNQEQITSCSHLVIVLAGIDCIKVENGEARKRISREGKSEEKLEAYLNLYAQYMGETLKSDEKIYEFTSKQTYIAIGNMMTAAAILGIDSCAIGGFDKDELEKLLDLDVTKYQVSLVLPFGYRLNPQPKKIRYGFDEVVEFLD